MSAQRHTAPGHSDVDREAIARFAAELFEHLPRADQRRWAEAYLCALITTPGRKSIRKLAAAITASSTAPQSLQQFISQSPWEWMPAREVLARRVDQQLRPQAWTIGRVIIPKRGEHSVGVHRRFDPVAGRTINCQLGIGSFICDDQHSLPVDWRILLTGRWQDDAGRRSRARVPGETAAQAEWRYVLDLADQLAVRWALTPAPLVADLRGLSGTPILLRELASRALEHVLEVDSMQQVLSLERKASVVTVREALRSNIQQPHVATVSGVDGRVRHLTFFSTLVGLPSLRPGSSRRRYRLVAEWSPAERRLTRFWLSSLTDRRVDEILSLLRTRTRTGAALQALATEGGVLDFEGRSFPGWHHHMTLASAAFAHLALPPQDAATGWRADFGLHDLDLRLKASAS